MPTDLRLDPGEIPLLNDLYEFTVAAAFFDRGMNEPASFDVGVRKLHANRGYMIAAGIERVIEALEEYRFDERALEHLESRRLFKPEFLEYLRGFRFTGTVRAMPEGSLYFGGEPVAEVRAPLIEAQIVEPLFLNQLGIASITATKAARCHSVAMGRRLVEFGLRRAQGADAGLVASRSSYLAGFHGTSNVLAGLRYGVPVFGTMSHSFIMAHESEGGAFEDFARSFPKLSTMLVDTYDSIRGVHNVVQLADRLSKDGIEILGIRLDSGDLLDLSRNARRILDKARLNKVSIFASGNLDEYKVADLLKADAPIDAFGIGTALTVSDDAPSADFTYKLSEYAGRGRLKTSAGKVTMPGRKQVFRVVDASLHCCGDFVGLIDESPVALSREIKPTPAQIVPMLEVVFENGGRIMPRPTLDQSRERFFQNFSLLDSKRLALRNPEPYPVKPTAALNAMIISEKLRTEKMQG